MSKFKLGRLYLDNFKSFKDPILFDFRDRELLLFDGPNGFGKTTIFDAVELCFRGEINRFIQLDKKKKCQHPLKNDNKKETTVCLELLDSSNSYFIHVSIEANPKDDYCQKAMISKRELLTNCQNIENIDNVDVFKETKSNLEATEISDIDGFLKENLDYKNLQATFNIFNYIQQENTTHFLKAKEADRHNTISYLFGVGTQQAELNNIQEMLDKLVGKNGKIAEKIAEKKELNTELQNLQALSETELDIIQSSQKIVQIMNVKIEQDSLSIIELYKDRLGAVKELILSLDDYKNYLYNKKIDEKMGNEFLLTDFIYLGLYEDYSKIESLKEQLAIEQKEKEKIDFFREIENKHVELTDLDENIINNYLKYFSDKKEDFSEKIARVPVLKSGMQSHEKLINSILFAQENLKKAYQNYLGEEYEGKTDCPFCGVEKESLNILFLEYQAQYEQFKEKLGQAADELNQINRKLKEELLTPIYQEMVEAIKSYDAKPQIIEVLKNRSINKERWDLVQVFKKYLLSKSIVYQSCLFPIDINDSHIEEVTNKVDQLKALLTSNKKTIVKELEFDEIINNARQFNIEYKLISEEPRLTINNDIIKAEDIEKDLNYLSFLKIKINNTVLQEKSKEYERLVVELEKLGLLRDNIKEIRDIYSEKIKQYEKDIVSKIKIPFYIYSSKILQTRLEGNGVFLETAIDERRNANNYIRFIASAKDDHDAWNTMSSGQLSGIVITFMLAMNKVFPTYFKTLLIDDPVQNMDEINMVSLLQLLRYEFSDYQLIMSTHNKNVSQYFKYKYDVIERKAETINVREHRDINYIKHSFN